MQYVVHGTLAVPTDIEKQYEQAKTYLSRDPNEARLFDKLEHATDGRHFRLRENHRGNDYFDPNSNTIGWDPYSALRTTTGGRQSPALGLGHEVDHADENPTRAQQLMRQRSVRFDNNEERRVILGSESHAARILGEGTRHDHAGRAYHVAAPTVCMVQA